MAKNKLSKSTKLSARLEGYDNLLKEIKSLLDQGRSRAYQAVDNIKVQTYWQIGERIVRDVLTHKDRAEYGEEIIKRLSLDLKTHERTLYRITKFFNTYPILTTLLSELSWSHYLILIDVAQTEERRFYERQTILHSWSVRELKKQLKSGLYKKTPQKEIQKAFKTKLPAVVPQKVFKDTYDFTFIELKPHKSERDLEKKLIDNFEKLLKELGEDFSILGRQVSIKIDSEMHYIDLILYHRGIPCIVLVDLKIGKLDSRDIGQMNKYIGYYRRNRQYEHEQDTIGLIICKEAGREEVMYALDGLEKKIFIAKYKVKLPSEEKIKKAIKKLK